MIYSILALNVGLNLMSDFTYRWNLNDLEKVEKNNLKVFSCFSCGGGSTMGYKMSGFEVIGCNEIDPEMMEVYKQNHNPKYSFLESITTFKLREDLPRELYGLDILDGSPPCSSFSITGNREKDWGKQKKFKEGQKDQILDDLFFHFIDLAHKLRPKVIVAENVKGMIIGKAKGYVKQVISLLKTAGYDVQLFLLNGATMGLPQRRERIFFIARRNDLNWSDLKLSFNEKAIPAKVALADIIDEFYNDCSKSINKKYWDKCKPGKKFNSVHPKGHLFNLFRVSKDLPFPTLTACSGRKFYRWDKMATFSTKQLCRISSFPENFKNTEASLRYQLGMSVPPLMMHKISRQIYKQWFQ